MALYKKSEYSLHVTDVLLSLQTAAQFHSKSKDEIWQPFGTYYGKHKEEKKNSVGHLSFKFPVKIQAED